MVADLSLDKAILKEAPHGGTFKPVPEMPGDNPRVRFIACFWEADMYGAGANQGYPAS